MWLVYDINAEAVSAVNAGRMPVRKRTVRGIAAADWPQDF